MRLVPLQKGPQRTTLPILPREDSEKITKWKRVLIKHCIYSNLTLNLASRIVTMSTVHKPLTLWCSVIAARMGKDTQLLPLYHTALILNNISYLS